MAVGDVVKYANAAPEIEINGKKINLNSESLSITSPLVSVGDILPSVVIAGAQSTMVVRRPSGNYGLVIASETGNPSDMLLHDSGAAVDRKNYQIQNDSAFTRHRALNDAGSSVIRVFLCFDHATGQVGIGGNPQASSALDIQSTIGALTVPRMTTAQRDALTAVNGMIIYNTTDDQFQKYEAGAWATL